MNRRKKTECPPDVMQGRALLKDFPRWLRNKLINGNSRTDKWRRAHRRRETRRMRKARAMQRTRAEWNRLAELAGIVRWGR